jgi:urease subunit gamma/beta
VVAATLARADSPYFSAIISLGVIFRGETSHAQHIAEAVSNALAQIDPTAVESAGDIELNAGRRKVTVKAVNTGDRPIQIGSHYHFFEANKALDFDRAASFGMHLDIPAGTAVRFEPGEAKQITLAAFGGSGEIFGLNSLTNGSTKGEKSKADALKKAKAQGFKGA